MASVIVINWVTLDGVMQGPGRPDEDTRDGFTHGGWAAPFSDELIGAAIGARLVGGHAWLFGRRTYEDLLASWSQRGGPFSDALNERDKYVASRDGSAELPWPNSILLPADVPGAVAELKAERGAPLVVMGSAVLIASLMAADLIDEYLLLIAPLVLGTGRRLFTDRSRTPLRLRDSLTSSTGVVIAAYDAVR